MNRDMTSDVEKMFKDGKMHFGLLGKNFPGVVEYFTRREQGEIKQYPNGVMSVVMKGTGENGVPSTLGYLPAGDFEFPTGSNQETMHFLAGSLFWGRNGEELTTPQQYDELTIPSNRELILQVRNPSLYICDYSPQI